MEIWHRIFLLSLLVTIASILFLLKLDTNMDDGLFLLIGIVTILVPLVLWLENPIDPAMTHNLRKSNKKGEKKLLHNLRKSTYEEREKSLCNLRKSTYEESETETEGENGNKAEQNTTPNQNKRKWMFGKFGKMMDSYYLLRVRFWKETLNEYVTNEEKEMGENKLDIFQEIQLENVDLTIACEEVTDGWTIEYPETQVIVDNVCSNSLITKEFELKPTNTVSTQSLSLYVNLIQREEYIERSRTRVIEVKEQEQAWRYISRFFAVAIVLSINIFIVEKNGKWCYIEELINYGLYLTIILYTFFVVLLAWFYAHSQFPVGYKFVGTLVGYALFFYFFDLLKVNLEISIGHILSLMTMIITLRRNHILSHWFGI